MTTPRHFPLRQRLVAELLGTAFLSAVVVGSGIAAARLSPSDAGLELLENALATGAGLIAIISMFSSISGAHLNPVVSFIQAHLREMRWRDAGGYALAQVLGAGLGAIGANAMFALPLVTLSTHARATWPHLLAELIATVGLILVIVGHSSSGRSSNAGIAVGGYIMAAYFFCSSTSFANPAIALGRMLSDTFAGIAPTSVPAFVLAELVGGLLAVVAIRLLYGSVVARRQLELATASDDSGAERKENQ